MADESINILVVEDDAAVRQFIAFTLSTSGFTVHQARDGVEALRLIDASHGAIAVLLVDVVMPRLNGKDLARAIHAVHPEIKIIFMSGYSEDTIADHGVAASNIRFLKKPFSSATLIKMVHDLLRV